MRRPCAGLDAFLTDGVSSTCGVSEGREALGTAGLETGATIFGDLRESRFGLWTCCTIPLMRKERA
jgi:hypothetical protein